MKKAVKTSIILLFFLVAVPSLAGLAITALWNGILMPACGFATIGFSEGAGLFLLGQVLTGGFVIGLFLIAGSLHKIFSGHHADWHSRWHSMTDRERLDFIERRRREHMGFRHRSNSEARQDAAE